MPLQIVEHPNRVVEPFLRGLLPDNDDVLKRWGREFGVSSKSPFALLSHVGEDCAGAVQFVRPEELAALDVGDIEWLDEEQVGARIRALRADPSSWQLTGREGRSRGQWSLAGAQAKMALLHHDGAWGRPSGRVPTTHILKPAITGLDDHDLNEHLCLELAGRLGLAAARTAITSFAGERAVVVTRYDRLQVDGRWSRVHQEDLCQALALSPDAKYQAYGGPSPEQIAGLFRRCMTAGDADRAVRAFVDALAVNWVLVGTDAHAKNYSILLSGGQVRLAPLYDVASVLPYDDSGGHDLRMAMKVGGRYDIAYVGRDNWSRLAQSVGLDPQETLDRVRALAAAVPQELAGACLSPAVVALESALPTNLLRRVTERAERCQERLDAPVERSTPQAWTPEHAAVLLAAVGDAQRRTLVATARAGGTLTSGQLMAVLDGERSSLRGLTGPVSKAIQRLQRQRALPPDLPPPWRTTHAVDAQGRQRVATITMPNGTAQAFGEAGVNDP